MQCMYAIYIRVHCIFTTVTNLVVQHIFYCSNRVRMTYITIYFSVLCQFIMKMVLS